MTFELLVSALGWDDPLKLAEQMNINSAAVIVDQCDTYEYSESDYRGHLLRIFRMNERGVGLSRNTALMRARADILLFADEDIVYEPDYEAKVLAEFEAHPEADILFFNVRVCPERRTYHNESFGRVTQTNCGRYPAYSLAVRREKLIKSTVTFSLLFGGGAKYSNGEDSLFIRQCLSAGLKAYKTTVNLGEEIPRQSTWFTGYHDKFFFDRGFLYDALYGIMAKPLAMRFLLKHRKVMCKDIPLMKAYGLMCDGIREARR